MRSLVNIFTVLVIGLALGGISAQYSIQRSHGIGAINVGPWSAWPFVGGTEVDPYTAAKVTTDGSIPLGAAEGLAFEAVTDQDGELLLRQCRYVLAGHTPVARLWTLVAYDRTGKILTDSGSEISAMYSGNVLRYPDSSFEIKISDYPQSGNWMHVEGEGAFKLVMRLYDTPITSNSGLINPEMPRIEKQECIE